MKAARHYLLMALATISIACAWPAPARAFDGPSAARPVAEADEALRLGDYDRALRAYE